LGVYKVVMNGLMDQDIKAKIYKFVPM
jgi:hypothetical protein